VQVTLDAATITAFTTAIDRTIGRALAPDERVALAVSGGPDSVAMLAMAAAAFPGRVIAATVDHGLRASAADEIAMVAQTCAGLGVPHAALAGTIDSAASLQAQARALRYRLLIGWAAQAGARFLATAHQADDQAETLLMRAARGAGLSGMAGVRARREVGEDAPLTLIRPLLDWRRAELRAVVRRAGLPFVDDPANDDPRHDRTRFRRLLNAHEWLDTPHIARTAAYLAEADDELRAIVDWLWAVRRAKARAGGVRIDITGLPRGLQRRLAQRAIGEVRRLRGLTAPDWSPEANVEPLLDALARDRAATQAGVLVRPEGTSWLFTVAPPRRPSRGNLPRSG
jgi:tRNA(Ile)-lysidine synthase